MLLWLAPSLPPLEPLRGSGLHGNLVLAESATAHLGAEYARALSSGQPSQAYSLRPLLERFLDPYLLYLLRWQLRQPVRCVLAVSTEPTQSGDFLVRGGFGSQAGSGTCAGARPWTTRLSEDTGGWWINSPSLP